MKKDYTFVNMSKQAKRDYINKALKLNKGRFFSAVNKKANGETRQWKAVRIGVKKGLQGGINTCKDKPNMVTVYERGQWRNLNIDTVSELKAQGLIIHFKEGNNNES